MMFLKAAILCLLCSLASQGALAQDNYFNLLGDQPSIEIPFIYQAGFIILEATINENHQRHFILDTGAENIVLFDYTQAEKMHMTKERQVMIWGSDLQNDIIAHISRSNKIKLPNTEELIKDFVILEKNVLNLGNVIGLHIDGLIGGRMFWGHVLKIDYQKQKLIISKKSAFDNQKLDRGYQSIDLEIVQNKPYINSLINLGYGGDISSKVLVDTGSGLGLLMLLDTHPSLILPQKHILGPLGQGLGGSIDGYIGRIKSLRLSSSLYFTQLISYFQASDGTLDSAVYNDRNGLIGNPILSRFSVIIDYVGQKLYLKPNKRYNKTIAFDRSGLLVIATGAQLNKFVIKTALKGSPAEKAGFEAEDQILRIGWRRTRWLNIPIISKLLQGRVGKKMSFLIERNGVEIHKKLVLEDYL